MSSTGATVQSDCNCIMEELSEQIRTEGFAVDVVAAGIFNGVPPWKTWEDVSSKADEFADRTESFGWDVDKKEVLLSTAIAINFPFCTSRSCGQAQLGAAAGQVLVAPGTLAHAILVAIGRAGIPDNIMAMAQIGDPSNLAVVKPGRRIRIKTAPTAGQRHQ